jgi:hypothetical protein
LAIVLVSAKAAGRASATAATVAVAAATVVRARRSLRMVHLLARSKDFDQSNVKVS